MTRGTRTSTEEGREKDNMKNNKEGNEEETVKTRQKENREKEQWESLTRQEDGM